MALVLRPGDACWARGWLVAENGVLRLKAFPGDNHEGVAVMGAGEVDPGVRYDISGRWMGDGVLVEELVPARDQDPDGIDERAVEWCRAKGPVSPVTARQMDSMIRRWSDALESYVVMVMGSGGDPVPGEPYAWPSAEFIVLTRWADEFLPFAQEAHPDAVRFALLVSADQDELVD